MWRHCAHLPESITSRYKRGNRVMRNARRRPNGRQCSSSTSGLTNGSRIIFGTPKKDAISDSSTSLKEASVRTSSVSSAWAILPKRTHSITLHITPSSATNCSKIPASVASPPTTTTTAFGDGSSSPSTPSQVRRSHLPGGFSSNRNMSASMSTLPTRSSTPSRTNSMDSLSPSKPSPNRVVAISSKGRWMSYPCTRQVSRMSFHPAVRRLPNIRYCCCIVSPTM